MFKTLRHEFQNPGPALRGAPFWSWNAELEPAELRRQIRLMRQMGFGGFFMHARTGLATPYLSERWFECVDACVDEAKKQGMFAWIYDEDRWPSGSAGGMVGKNHKLRAKRVVRHASRAEFAPDAELLGVFDVALDPNGAMVSYAAADENAPKAAGAERVFFARESIETAPWFNHQAYIDVLDPDAVGAFIQTTHEAYRRHCGAAFDGVIPGVFTDEPTYRDTHGLTRGHPSLPWTPRLPAWFKKRFKYDVTARLPELFFPFASEAPSRARWHYYDALTQMFCDTFAKPVSDWCVKNNLLFTGHLYGEENIIQQTRHACSVMRFYPHFQAPGMDLLCEHNREYDTAKQVASVARQFSRKWRLSETDGCTGWDFSFAGHKALGDWQAALGINLRCPHLAWYSMQGEAKRDYPASIFYQSPWAAHYAFVEDYYARVNVLMTRGVEIRRILVVHPIESAWLYMAHDKGLEKPEALCVQMTALRDTLLEKHLDFDYGEETLMRDFGVVEGKRFRLKDATYDVVVVPHTHTIRSTTLGLLEQFADAGGALVWVSIPELVDAQPSGRAAKLATRTIVATSAEAVATALEKFRTLSIADPAGNEIPCLIYHLREDADAAYLFVCNTSHGRPEWNAGAPLVRDRTLAFPNVTITGLAECLGAPVECDPETGAFFCADAKRRKNGAWHVSTSCHALGSRLFLFPKKADAAASKLPKRPCYETLQTLRVKPARWGVFRDEPNVLLLESPAVKIRGGAFAKPQNFMRADDAIHDAMEIPRRVFYMPQPWTRKLDSAPKPPAIPVTLRYTFDCEVLPGGPVDLAIECPEIFSSVTLNGQPANLDLVNGWWCDASLRRVPLPAAFQLGANTLELRLDYPADFTGLENIYLLGEFGAAQRPPSAVPVMTARPGTLKLGDWISQGLPFYSGSVRYTTRLKRPAVEKGRRVFIRVPAYAGTALRVFMDGRCAGLSAWAPNEVDVTDFLPATASCELGVEIISSRRNSHGPFHLDTPTPKATGPRHFTIFEKGREIPQLVPCGLLAAPELIIKEQLPHERTRTHPRRRPAPTR